jgi:putative ABC transport system permease protein
MRALRKIRVERAFRLAVIGVFMGIIGVLASARFLKTLLFQIQPSDPATLLAVALLLTLVAVFFAWLPARIHPMEALCNE